MTAKKAVYEILDLMENGSQFSGIDLQRWTRSKTEKQLYPSTALRHMRSYRMETGRQIVNVNNDKSIYRIVG